MATTGFAAARAPTRSTGGAGADTVSYVGDAGVTVNLVLTDHDDDDGTTPMVGTGTGGQAEGDTFTEPSRTSRARAMTT